MDVQQPTVSSASAQVVGTAPLLEDEELDELALDAPPLPPEPVVRIDDAEDVDALERPPVPEAPELSCTAAEQAMRTRPEATIVKLDQAFMNAELRRLLPRV